MDDVPTIRRILTENNVLAVVGLSANESRPSFFAAKYMQDHGYKIIPVNPRYDEILGNTCYPDLESIPEPVDIVDVFQRPDRVMPLAESAVAIKAKVLWMQLGVVNQEAEQGLNIRLEVDGGVKLDNISDIAASGADTFVAGSAIFGSEDYASTIVEMKKRIASVSPV